MGREWRVASRWRRLAAAWWIVAWSTLAGGSWAAEPGGDWVQWRGPARDGLVGQALPDGLGGERLQRLWRSEESPSYSGPLVTESLVITTATRDKKVEVVRAYDRLTGRLVWEASWEGALTVPFFAASNGSWIRATPAADEQRLYVAGMRDRLVCLDLATGKQLWQFDFMDKMGSPLPAFGFVSSPLLDDEAVYVQAGASVNKLDKRTGELLWQTLKDSGGTWGSAFSSPVFATLGGQRQLLVQTRNELAAVDPASGKVLWKQAIEAFRGMNILTPTVVGQAIFTSSYGGKSLMLSAKDPSQELWANKAQGYMSTPVVIGGHIYLHLRNQRFTCLDAASGETRWTTQPFGKYWSLISDGDKILALDERGELLLIRANPEKFELLDRRRVSDDPTWAHVAVRGDLLVVRELNGLSVYRWR